MADTKSPEQLRADRINKLVADLEKVSEPGIKAALEKQLEAEKNAQCARAVQVFQELDRKLEGAVRNLRDARNLAKAAEKEVDALDEARDAFVSGEHQGNVDVCRETLKKAGINFNV
jgi:CRISPR/Cas system CMR-associated protein Cmr1 (group 7 of RAMP superfamily)